MQNLLSRRFNRLFLAQDGQRKRTFIWFVFSLAVAACFCLPVLRIAFSQEWVVQDDARQHVFWMQRFVDPELFPNDLLADYFQSVAPWGYTALYKSIISLGLDPLLVHKLLPPVIALITTGYYYGFSLAIFPVPFVAFLSCFLFNQNLWLRDDIVSATPTAFVYPFFVAFLYYLLRGSLLPCLVTIILLGLFYPQAVFISLGILFLRLFRLSRGLRLSYRRHIVFFLAGLAVGIVVMLPYALKSSEYGPVVTLEEARQLPEFYAGWSQYFRGSWVNYWLCGIRSGFFPFEWCQLGKVSWEQPFPMLPPALIAALLLLPLRLVPNRFPLVKKITQHWIVLLQIILVSIGMFAAAHLLLFRIHLPSRYIEHSWRVIIPVMGAIALGAMLDTMVRWSKRHQAQLFSRPISLFLVPYVIVTLLYWFIFSSPGGKKGLVVWLLLGAIVTALLSWWRKKYQQKSGRQAIVGATVLLILLIWLYPVMYTPGKRFSYPRSQYLTAAGNESIYEFFAQQPKDSVIASLAYSQAVIPSFSERSVLLGGEGFVLPYHRGYYRQIAQRATDLIKAQYSPNLADIRSVIDKYGIDFWLLERDGLTLAYLTNYSGLQPFEPERSAAIAQLEQGAVPALMSAVEGCTVAENNDLIVLAAVCIEQDS